MATYTPGPWAIKRTFSNECETCPHIVASDGSWVAEVVGAVYLGHQQTIPNAKLIAAAPDLLAACKKLIDAEHYDHFAARMSDSEMEGIEAIKAAINKAEGRVIS